MILRLETYISKKLPSWKADGVQTIKAKTERVVRGETFMKLPYCRVASDGLSVTEELAEVYTICGLPFQYGITEAVPLLELQHLNYNNWVYIGFNSLGSLVAMEGLDIGSESLSVDDGSYLGEFVYSPLELLIVFAEKEGFESL